MNDQIYLLRGAGFAVHWLHPGSKRPIGDDWQNRPVQTVEQLRASYRTGNNVGVLLGEPGHLRGIGYHHVLDIDIRVDECADEAWDALRELLPDVDFDTLPLVASGSGGESRHVHFITDRPFYGKKLAVSEGKHGRESGGKQVWSYDWEIELFGTGKQVVLPPSIHPDTGLQYRWLTPFDLDDLLLGFAPTIPSDQLDALGAAETATYAFETREPLEFKPGQLESDLALIPIARLDDYHDWIMLGQALHHQFGGSDEGYDLWVEHSKRSCKYNPDGSREMRRKWRGFGRSRRQPVTMGTIRQWAQAERQTLLAAQFDNLFDTDEPEADPLGDLFDTDDDPLNKPVPVEWTSLLHFNEEGGLKPTLHNIELVVKNDPRLKNLPQLNLFTQETVQRTMPGSKPARRNNPAKQMRQLEGPIWDVADPVNGDIWTSARDHAVRSILEAPKTQGGHEIQLTDRNLKAATVLAAWENAFHPVRDYLTGLKWDGKPRIANLFTTYLGTPDNSYTRDVGRLMMVAAVTRVFEPGHKWDYAVILEGLQGKRKSTFIQTLARNWFAELDGDFHDAKDMVEKMQGAWIMEMPELSGFNRSDVRSIKAFISRQADKVRLAYEARAALFPRQCIFIGSTNDSEYLKDDTGGRRFFPIECVVDSIDIDTLRTQVDQLWAEAYVVYQQMRVDHPKSRGDLPLYLSDRASALIASELQESRRVETSEDTLVGQIEAWLERPMTSGSLDDPDEGQLRQQTCLIQIWCECLGQDQRAYDLARSHSLGRAMRRASGWKISGNRTFKRYGKQRAYVKVG